MSCETGVPQQVTEPTAADEIAADLAARFERDVIPLVDTLFRGAARLTLQRADAEDLVQETMMRAYTSFGTFQEGTNLKGWLLRIQANAHISGYRKKLCRPLELPIAANSDWHEVCDAHRPPRTLRSAEVQVLDLWPDDDIRDAMAALPVEFQMAVYYADIEGLSYKQISAIVRAPLGTVMSRIHRGRSRLRVRLASLAVARGYA